MKLFKKLKDNWKAIVAFFISLLILFFGVNDFSLKSTSNDEGLVHDLYLENFQRNIDVELGSIVRLNFTTDSSIVYTTEAVGFLQSPAGDWADVANLKDEDFDTYGYLNSGTSATYYEAYIIPDGATTDTRVRFKDSRGIVNITFNDNTYGNSEECMTNNTGYLTVAAYVTNGPNSAIYCFNGISYVPLTTAYADDKIYEWEILWVKKHNVTFTHHDYDNIDVFDSPNGLVSYTTDETVVDLNVTYFRTDENTEGESVFNISYPVRSYLYQEDPNLTYVYNDTTTGYIEINYTKPADICSGAVHLWQVKHDTLDAYNITLPIECVENSEDSIAFRIDVSAGADAIGRCYNGTGWEDITEENGADTIAVGYESTAYEYAYDGSWTTAARYEAVNGWEKWAGLYSQFTMWAEDAMIWNMCYNNDTFYISAHEKDELVNVTLELDGYETNGTYPTGVRIYINDSLSNSLGVVSSGVVELTDLYYKLLGTWYTVNFRTYAFGGDTEVSYLVLPKTAQVQNAQMTMTAQASGYADIGNGTDGNLTFTSTKKEYGTMSTPADYVVSGNTLYLKTNRKYNFINFQIGPGMTLSTQDTNGAVMYIAANVSMNISGTVDLSGVTQYGDYENSVTIDSITYTVPGVRNGGMGASDTGNTGGSQVLGFGGGGGGSTVSHVQWSGYAYGGDGANGYSSFGTYGLGATASVSDSGEVLDNGGDGTVGSAGGGGGAGAKVTSPVGSCDVVATGGNGGTSFGALGAGGGGYMSHTSTWSCTWWTVGGGGGGAGGKAGQSGVNLVLKTYDINITGTIDTSGTAGQAGGNGGQDYFLGDDYIEKTGYGAAGGGGGGGGSAGDVIIYATHIDNEGTITRTGGSGGAGGQRYSASSWVNSGSSGTTGTTGALTENIIAYVDNPALDVGIQDGAYEWSYSGTFNTEETVANFTEEVMDYLASCTADSDGFCNVPFYLTGESDGYLQVNTITVEYTNDNNPVVLNLALISEFLNSSDGHTNIPIKIYSTQNGTILVSDIRYDYRGGNKTYTVTAVDLDTEISTEYNITYYYSDYTESLPQGLEYVDFYPQSYTQKNVSAYGQTNLIPIFNVSTENYGGLMNLSLLTINPNACFNITYSTTNDGSDGGELINNTWFEVGNNLDYESNPQIWLWASLTCSGVSGIGYPDFYFRGCAEGADVCDGDI